MNKKDLRIKYKELRKNLTDTDIEDLSIKIANQTLQLPIWEKNNFHVFLPIQKQKEVNTEFLIHILNGRDKNVIISKSNFYDTTMTHYLLTDNTKLKENEYGIPEPIQGIKINEEEIEVVFVPLLTFDLSGNRVGYGKGFYDKFLSNCNKTTIKIGLNYFYEDVILDVNQYDITLDYVVTPDKIFTF